MSTLRGRCPCGAVTFEIASSVSALPACHGFRCRRLYGAAFGPIAIAEREDE